MISAETEARLLRLRDNEANYLPLPEEAAKIAGKTLVCFTGATGMGKNSIMSGLVELHPHIYGEFNTIVTREPRDSDNKAHYTYYEHTDEGLAPLLARIEAGRILQYVVLQGSLSIRATEASSYPNEVNLGDIVPQAFPAFDRLGFGRIAKLSIVTEPSAWKKHLDERFPADHPDRAVRIHETITNLEWSISQTTGSDHGWIINHDGKLAEAIQAADRAITRNEFVDQDRAQALGVACLQVAKELAA